MSNASFEIDTWSLLLFILFCFAIFLIWQWTRHFVQPLLFFSNTENIHISPTSRRIKLAKLPKGLEVTALALFSFAFIDPHFFLPKEGGYFHTPSEGIAMYLVLDQSGSMRQKVTTTSYTGRYENIPKIELVKKLTAEFVKGNPQMGLIGRPHDLIGLIFFARTTQVKVPLTLDHNTILKELDSYHVVTTPEENGTSIGYAIFKTANLISATRHYAQDLAGATKPAYEIKNSVIVLVTDGFQEVNALDINNPRRSIGVLEAAEYAKEHNVRLYVVNVEPALAKEEFAPQRRLMQRATELTGGRFYLMDSSSNLGHIYADIDQLEKSILPTEDVLSKDQQPHLYHRISLYPALIALGMLALFVSTILRTVTLRQIP